MSEFQITWTSSPRERYYSNMNALVDDIAHTSGMTVLDIYGGSGGDFADNGVDVSGTDEQALALAQALADSTGKRVEVFKDPTGGEDQEPMGFFEPTEPVTLTFDEATEAEDGKRAAEWRASQGLTDEEPYVLEIPSEEQVQADQAAFEAAHADVIKAAEAEAAQAAEEAKKVALRNGDGNDVATEEQDVEAIRATSKMLTKHLQEEHGADVDKFTPYEERLDLHDRLHHGDKALLTQTIALIDADGRRLSPILVTREHLDNHAKASE